MAGLCVADGAESELLASPFAILNSSSEPIEPDVSLDKETQKTTQCKFEVNCATRAVGRGHAMGVATPPHVPQRSA